MAKEKADVDDTAVLIDDAEESAEDGGGCGCCAGCWDMTLVMVGLKKE